MASWWGADCKDDGVIPSSSDVNPPNFAKLLVWDECDLVLEADCEDDECLSNYINRWVTFVVCLDLLFFFFSGEYVVYLERIRSL